MLLLAERQVHRWAMFTRNCSGDKSLQPAFKRIFATMQECIACTARRAVGHGNQITKNKLYLAL